MAGEQVFAGELLFQFLDQLTEMLRKAGNVWDSIPPFQLFFGASAFVFVMYYVLHYLLEWNVAAYRNLPNFERKRYVVSNLLKSMTCFLITLPGVHAIGWEAALFDRWNSQRITNLTVLYAVPDFVSLIMVRHMMRSTVFHHVAVQVFALLSVYNDYDVPNLWRPMVVYGICSAFAYMVNFHLSTRFLIASHLLRWMASTLSNSIYILCCVINWSWQLYYVCFLLCYHHHWALYCYMAGVFFWIKDDIVLIKFLHHDSGKRRRLMHATVQEMDESKSEIQRLREQLEEKERELGSLRGRPRSASDYTDVTEDGEAGIDQAIERLAEESSLRVRGRKLNCA